MLNMTKGNVNHLLFFLLLGLGWPSSSAVAYVLGGIEIQSALNEPLNAKIPLTDLRREEVDSLRFELRKLAKVNGKQPTLATEFKQAKIRADLKFSNGQPYLLLTSDSPLYRSCTKKTFSCYNFYNIGVVAKWSTAMLDNQVVRRYPIIPNMDKVLGGVKLHSAFGEPLDAHIDLMAEGRLKDFKIRLAPKQAWEQGVDFGKIEYEFARKVDIRFQMEADGLRLTSSKRIKRIFINRIQTTHAPLVLLLEATWNGGRELKKYTIYMPI